VRTEIGHALQAGKRILPIVLAKDAMPRAEALPSDLQKLGFIQPFELRDDRWESDLSLLIRELEELGLPRATVSPVRYPKPRVTITEIPQAEFSSILRSLPGWTEEVSPSPGQEPLKRIELRKAFEFESFECAIEFMREVSEHVSRVGHHPRWENIWRTVTIWLSTWDIGQKPSQLDVDMAHEIERIYKKY